MQIVCVRIAIIVVYNTHTCIARDIDFDRKRER